MKKNIILNNNKKNSYIAIFILIFITFIILIKYIFIPIISGPKPIKKSYIYQKIYNYNSQNSLKYALFFDEKNNIFVLDEGVFEKLFEDNFDMCYQNFFSKNRLDVDFSYLGNSSNELIEREVILKINQLSFNIYYSLYFYYKWEIH